VDDQRPTPPLYLTSRVVLADKKRKMRLCRSVGSKAHGENRVQVLVAARGTTRFHPWESAGRAAGAGSATNGKPSL